MLHWKLLEDSSFLLPCKDSIQQCRKDIFKQGNKFVTWLSVLDEIISKAFAGDFWAALDFSPRVFLVSTRCHASEWVSLQNAQHHKSNHQNSMSFWPCAIELSLKIHFCWKHIHLNHTAWFLQAVLCCLDHRGFTKFNYHFSNTAGTCWTLNNEEFSAANLLRTVNYCYIEPAVPGIIRSFKG